MKNKLTEIRKLNEAIESLDKMAKAVVELSYKAKIRIIKGDIEGLSADLLRDILVLRDAQEKNLNHLHEELSDSINASDLYSMIS